MKEMHKDVCHGDCENCDSKFECPNSFAEPKKCKFGKKVFDKNCYDCIEFIKGRCGV